MVKPKKGKDKTTQRSGGETQYRGSKNNASATEQPDGAGSLGGIVIMSKENWERACEGLERTPDGCQM